MKFFILSLIVLMGRSYATVEAHARVYIVVKHIESEEFFIERVPVIGCYGLSYGPQLVQFTSSYKTSSKIGCGPGASFEDINYLTCAKVISTKEAKDYSTITQMTIDISRCEDRDNAQLITMIRTAAKLNFPQPKGEITLEIIK